MYVLETNRRRIQRRLEREGWYLARHGANHDLYEHPERQVVIALPRHRTVSSSVAHAIARAAGWRK